MQKKESEWKPKSLIMWVNHLSLLAGDPSVITSLPSASSPLWETQTPYS
jgi:hypothetical protein